jgi:4-hydroxybenzoate polyprenyltransferase
MLIATSIALSFPIPHRYYLLVLGIICLIGELSYQYIRRRLPLSHPIMAIVLALFPAGGYLAVSHPTLTPLVLFFIIFFWELGPHNQGADIVDLERDHVCRTKTLATCLGVNQASRLALLGAILTVVSSSLLFLVTNLGPIYLAGAMITGTILLGSSILLVRNPINVNALREFRNAKLYVLGLFSFVVLDILFSGN